jgi:hypothetical protein
MPSASPSLETQAVTVAGTGSSQTTTCGSSPAKWTMTVTLREPQIDAQIRGLVAWSHESGRTMSNGASSEVLGLPARASPTAPGSNPRSQFRKRRSRVLRLRDSLHSGHPIPHWCALPDNDCGIECFTDSQIRRSTAGVTPLRNWRRLCHAGRAVARATRTLPHHAILRGVEHHSPLMEW